MGELVDLMLEGILCMQCGSFIDHSHAGHPRACADCEEWLEDPRR